jgi:cell division protein FtsX
VLLLFLGKELVVSRIISRFDDASVNAMAFFWNAAILVAFGLVLGALGSGMTLRRFLKV